MSDSGSTEVDEKIVQRLMQKIVRKENEAISAGTSDAAMVKWIQGKIEEEVSCKLNH